MNNRIFQILKSFSHDEIRRFRDYLNSPFFNRSNKLSRLYSEITYFYPFFISDELNYKNLHFKVSPKITYNSATMRGLFSDLEKHAINFLRQISLESDETGTHNYLRSELQSRSLGKIFEKSIKEYEENFSLVNVIDENYFLNKLYLETDKFNYSYLSKNISKKINVDSLILYLVAGSKYLFLYFTMKMVSHYLDLQTMYANYREIEERNSLEEFLKKFFNGLDNFYLKGFLKDKKSDYYFVYDIYFNMFKAYSEKNGIEYYKNCKKLLYDFGKYFKTDEKQLLFGKLIDYNEMNLRNKSRSDKFTERELVKLYELVLAKKYYETEAIKYIPVTLFRNLISFAVRIRKFKWAEKFIKIYSNRLYPDFRNDLKNIGFARLNNARRNFSESLKYLNKVNPESAGVKFDYKSLMIMVHYELGNYEYVISQLDSFRHFITRTRTISKERKTNFRNFIYFVERFVKFMNNRNKTYLNSLEYKIKSEEGIAYRDWLREKVKGLTVSRVKAA